MRAAHIEVVNTISSDSFINALRRFIGRREKPAKIFNEKGYNFVGAEKELFKALVKFNHTAVARHLLQKNIQWHFNPPYASHMGGVWRRPLRTFLRMLY